MAFNRPTLQQIITRIEGDFTSRFGAQSSKLRRSWISIISRAYGGAVHLLYGFLGWVALQMFTDTADAEQVIQEAGIFGLTLKSADFAQGWLDITASFPSSIPAGTAWLRADGYRYTLMATKIVSTGANTVEVIAETAGANGNLDVGAAVTLESPVPGIVSAGTVHATIVGGLPTGIVGGVDEETIEELRARLIARKQKPAQGGSKADLEAWALEVTGVATAKVYGPKDIQLAPPIPAFGTAYVYVATSDPDDPTPSGALVESVQDYLDERKEVTANIEVYAIELLPIDVTISLAITDGYTEQEARDQIELELIDLLSREGLPQSTLRLSQINEAISAAVAEAYHATTLPVADTVIEADQIARLRTLIINPF